MLFNPEFTPTQRETQIVGLLTDGLSSKQIADRLALSKHRGHAPSQDDPQNGGQEYPRAGCLVCEKRDGLREYSTNVGPRRGRGSMVVGLFYKRWTSPRSGIMVVGIQQTLDLSEVGDHGGGVFYKRWTSPRSGIMVVGILQTLDLSEVGDHGGGLFYKR